MVERKLSLTEATALGVGLMIGASIFSIFGVGVSIAKNWLPVSFIVSAFFALCVVISYAALSKYIISNAGPMAFIFRAFGDNVWTGTLSIVYWLSYVVSISLFAKGFSGYFVPLFKLPDTKSVHLFVEILFIVFFMMLNFFGAKAVGKFETWIVLIKISILLLFITVGFLHLHVNYLTKNYSVDPLGNIIIASAVFFISYMGFGLITNASENIRYPKKNVPRAMLLSLGIVTLIYLGVAIAAVGNLSLSDLIKAKDNALAVAAYPTLGNFGFFLISIGALFSISSAMNATLFGGANVSYSLARRGDLPKFFDRKVWFNSKEGLYITAMLGIIFVSIFNIEGIATITSAASLLVYLFVILSHYKLRNLVGGNGFFILVRFFILLFTFFVILNYQIMSDIDAFYGVVISVLSCFVLEVIYRLVVQRRFKVRALTHRQ